MATNAALAAGMMYSDFTYRPGAIDLEVRRIGTSEHYRWLHAVVKAVIVLNLLDAVFTLWWVRTGMAVEANELLRDMVNEHPMAFVMVKLSLVSLGSLVLWFRRQRPLAVIAIFSAFLIYYLILLYHIQFSSRFLPFL